MCITGLRLGLFVVLMLFAVLGLWVFAVGFWFVTFGFVILCRGVLECDLLDFGLCGICISPVRYLLL